MPLLRWVKYFSILTLFCVVLLPLGKATAQSPPRVYYYSGKDAIGNPESGVCVGESQAQCNDFAPTPFYFTGSTGQNQTEFDTADTPPWIITIDNCHTDQAVMSGGRGQYNGPVTVHGTPIDDMGDCQQPGGGGGGGGGTPPPVNDVKTIRVLIALRLDFPAQQDNFVKAMDIILYDAKEPDTPIQTVQTERAQVRGNRDDWTTDLEGVEPGDYKVCVPDLGVACKDVHKAPDPNPIIVRFEEIDAPAGVYEQTTDKRNCEDKGGLEGWVFCPIIHIADGVLNTLDTNIRTLLEIDSQYYSNAQFKTAWGTIRNLAYLILVPVTLVMVIATALGFDFISAYTVRKALPRLVLVVIGIALSYALCVFLIDFFNVLGRGTFGLITAPFPGARDLTLTNLLSEDTFSELLASVAIVALVALFFIPIVTAVIIGFLVLILRQMLIVGLILLSPVALLGWIFPANQRLWNLWWGTFTKLLIMFPMIEALIALGRVFAWLIHPDARAWAPLLRPAALFSLLGWHGFAQLDKTFLGSSVGAGAVMVIPYGLIPATYFAAGSVLGFAAGKMKEGAGKLRGATWDRRKERRKLEKLGNKETRQARRQGNALAQNTRLDVLGQRKGPVGWAAGRAAAVRRRRTMRKQGQISKVDLLTPAGREGVRAEEEKLHTQAVEEGAQGDNIGIGGDDALSHLYAMGLPGREIDRQYAAKRNISIRDARRKRKQFERQYDVRAGSIKAVSAGVKANMGSGTNTTPEYREDIEGRGIDPLSEQARTESMIDLAEVVAPRVAAGMDADTMAKQLSGANRVEWHGGGHTSQVKFIKTITQNYKDGKTGADLLTMPDGQNAGEVYLSEAIEKVTPGQVVGGEKWTMETLAPVISKDINKHLERSTDPTLNDAQRLESRKKGMQLLGKLHSWALMVPHGSVEVQRSLAKGALDRKVQGTDKQFWEVLDSLEAPPQPGSLLPGLSEGDREEFLKSSRKLYPSGGRISPEMMEAIRQGRASLDMPGVTPTGFGG